ncbi:MAG: tRNA pseudouridine(13) synthase TruD [Planctomycetaceae bacterium]|nr:tRNA pseudouridine(13) synthase TruD [Planctomycetaceae bacterium]
MRIKHRIGDFRVRELLEDGFLEGSGPHRIYRVTKRKLTTPEAAAILAREAGLRPADVCVAGLKDRQGITIQHMSVEGGDVVHVEQSDLRIEPIGYAREALSSHHSLGNAFEIRVRGLSRPEVDTLRGNLDRVRSVGVPNYFDDQRFGNIRHGQGWIVRDLFQGRFDAALRAIIATPPKPQGHWQDHPEFGGFERGLSERWGDFEACLDLARKTGKHRSVFEHLVEHPGDYAGALRFVGQRVRLIHLFAWQSHLWNRSVAEFLRSRIPAAERVVLDCLEGPLVCHDAALPEGVDLERTFPLPADGLEQDLSTEERDLLEDCLAQEGLVADQMRVRDLDGFVQKDERRPMFVVPQHLRVRPAEPDTEERGAWSIKMGFELPRGAYATLVVKRLLARAGMEQAAQEDGEYEGDGYAARGAGHGRGASRPGRTFPRSTFRGPNPSETGHAASRRGAGRDAGRDGGRDGGRPYDRGARGDRGDRQRGDGQRGERDFRGGRDQRDTRSFGQDRARQGEGPGGGGWRSDRGGDRGASRRPWQARPEDGGRGGSRGGYGGGYGGGARFGRPREDGAREERPRFERPAFQRPDPRGSDDDRPRFDRPRNDRGRDDRGREDRGREDRGRFERPRFERPRDDRGRDDRPRDGGPREDRPRDERPRGGVGGSPLGGWRPGGPPGPGAGAPWADRGARGGGRDGGGSRGGGASRGAYGGGGSNAGRSYGGGFGRGSRDEGGEGRRPFGGGGRDRDTDRGGPDAGRWSSDRGADRGRGGSGGGSGGGGGGGGSRDSGGGYGQRRSNFGQGSGQSFGQGSGQGSGFGGGRPPFERPGRSGGSDRGDRDAGSGGFRQGGRDRGERPGGYETRNPAGPRGESRGGRGGEASPDSGGGRRFGRPQSDGGGPPADKPPRRYADRDDPLDSWRRRRPDGDAGADQ